MKRNSIRFLIVFGGLTIMGITITQIYWVRKAFDIKEQEFTVNVSLGLKNVAGAILKHDHKTPDLSEPVTRLSYKYFVADINAPIEPELLDSLIRAEFAKRNINTNFGFVIYNDQKLVFTRCVAVSNADTNSAILQHLPGWGDHKSFFGVYFPNEDNLIFSQMGIWTFSSVVLLFMILFFCYTLYIILRQKRLSEIQKDFVNNMAHEFNTPISAIIASAEVLGAPGNEGNPERRNHYLSIVSKEAVRLKKQVEKVLQVAASDKENLTLHKELIHLEELINGSVAVLRQTEKGRNALISTNFPDLETIIIADQMHLANVFYNLIDNSVKYSGDTPELIITIMPQTKGIVLSFEDHGTGIARGDMHKIFDKFYRVHHGNTHDVKGFGLGLNYVKNIVKAHRGTITLESEPGKGSIFQIFLPKV